MGNIESLLEAAKAIASDTIPVGGNSEGASIILQIFQANPDKYFTGKMLKKLFEEEGIEVKAVSNVLFALRKAGSLVVVKTGVYQLAPTQ